MYMQVCIYVHLKKLQNSRVCSTHSCTGGIYMTSIT